MEVLQKGKVSEKCQEEAVSLMGCYSDGSLAIKTGCCAKECAEAIDKVGLCCCVLRCVRWSAAACVVVVGCCVARLGPVLGLAARVLAHRSIPEGGCLCILHKLTLSPPCRST